MTSLLRRLYQMFQSANRHSQSMASALDVQGQAFDREGKVLRFQPRRDFRLIVGGKDA